jgi:adenosylhomocysteine nucleosidase
MDTEAVHLRRRMMNPVEAPVSLWRRTCGQIGDVPVELIVCGIGLINAAAATAVACLGEKPRAIFNYGCSGAHRDDIDCGDVVIGERVIHFSSYYVEPEGELKYTGFRIGVEDHEHFDTLPGDPELLGLARRAAANIELPAWPGIGHTPGIHFGGVGSADIWTQHGETIRGLHNSHGSLCEEMEAAAVAQVAATFGVPFLAVKDISNNELQVHTDLSDGGDLLLHVQDEIGLRAGLLVEQVIRTLD